MKHTKAQIMDGVEHKTSKVIANNTIEYVREDGTRVIRLHLTDIVEFLPTGKIRLNSGGWRTPTTKARMNNQLMGWQIWQEKGQWFLGQVSHQYAFPEREKCQVYHFHDGMIIDGNDCDGELYDPATVKEKKKELRDIRKYAKDYMVELRKGNVPAPSGADCWYCSMLTTSKTVGEAMGEEIETLGEAMERGRASHIRSHIFEDRYYVPSLLARAAEVKGVSQAAMWCLGSIWQADKQPSPSQWGSGIGMEQLEKALYKYCAQQLGHAV